MIPAPAGNLLEHLSQIPDPRGRHGRRHPLGAMLAAVVCAILQGARGYKALAEWLHCQDVTLWHALGFTRRPPRRGAFRKLLIALPAADLEQALSAWILECLGEPTDEALQPTSMDGKTLCGTLQPHTRAVHLLALLDQKTGCVLSQVRVNEKTNEAKAALELLRTLVLKGRIITGDAMFCDRQVCQEVIDSGGHYFFVVKDNQPHLKEAIAAEFQAAFSPDERSPAPGAPGRRRKDDQGAWPYRSPPLAGYYAAG